MRIKTLIERCIELDRTHRGRHQGAQHSKPRLREALSKSAPGTGVGNHAPRRSRPERQPSAVQDQARTIAMRAARALAYEFRPRPSFARRIESALDPLLEGNQASANALASALGISRQTLHRRLREQGTSFTEVLAARRHQLAMRYLGREGASVKVIAWRLGFSSPEAFSRAFKRWTGRSPSQFRAEHRASVAGSDA